MNIMAAGPATAFSNLLLGLAILLGLVVAVITYLNSRKLKGEVFEKPFILLAVGMLFVVLSLASVTVFKYALGDMAAARVHDLSFIVGFVLMLMGSMKVTRYLQGMEKFMKKLK